jgi:hypothetical protein
MLSQLSLRFRHFRYAVLLPARMLQICGFRYHVERIRQIMEINLFDFCPHFDGAWVSFQCCVM